MHVVEEKEVSTNTQVEPLDEESISKMMELADDEKIVFEEE